MLLSEKTRCLLMNTIAVSPILKRFMLPGIIGMLLTGVGVWQEMEWLTITGFILAAPVLWCYVVVIAVYPLILLFSKAPKRHWEE